MCLEYHLNAVFDRVKWTCWIDFGDGWIDIKQDKNRFITIFTVLFVTEMINECTCL